MEPAAKCNKMVIRKKLKGGRCIMLDFRKAKIGNDNRYIKNLLFDERESREIVTKNLNKEKDKEKSNLAKKQAVEEKKKQELLAKQQAAEEKKKQELLAKQQATEEKKKRTFSKTTSSRGEEKTRTFSKTTSSRGKEKTRFINKKKSEKKFDEKKKKIKTDSSAPEIIVAENITTNSQVYVLKGTVKDKSEFIFEIDGQPLELDKDGNFVLEGFIIDEEVGEELNLVAIDRWNNVSEKTVKIEVKLEEPKVVKSFEKLMPNKINIKKMIIGLL